MKLLKTSLGTVLDVHVKPNSRENRIKIEENEIVVFRKEKPAKGKVNRELTNELSALFKTRVEIVSGFSSRQKRILIRDASPAEICHILSEIDPDAKSGLPQVEKNE